MDNTLLITGASRGIGYSTAAFFLKNNWQVINLSRQPCLLDKVKNFEVDFSHLGWEKAIKEKLIKEFPQSQKISIIHCSSTYGASGLENIEAKTLRKDFEVNLIAPVLLNQVLLSKMLPGSSILYLGSTLSEKAVKGVISYVISKHGVVGLMRSSCQDLAGTGIHTCCVCPGFTDTEMLRQHLKDDSDLLESVKTRVGENRLIQPEEIAQTLYFCANNPVINGSVIHANLGQIEN